MYVIKNRGQIPGCIYADLSAIASGFIHPADPGLDLYFNKTKTEVSEDTVIATGFHDPGRSYKDRSYTSTKPKREVSGDNLPGRTSDLSAIALESQEVNLLAVFGMDLLAIALEFHDPRQSQIRLIRWRNPKGKSQEIILLAVFGTDLSAITSEFHDPW